MQCISSEDAEKSVLKIVHINLISSYKVWISTSEKKKDLKWTSSDIHSLTFVLSDPECWLEQMFDSQRYDIVKRELRQIDIDFPFNAAKRRFPTVHYKRVMNYGETVS